MIVTNANQRIGASGDYEWKSAAIVVGGTDGTTNLNTKTGFTTLFDDVRTARHIRVESDATLYLRLNAADNDKITVTATTPFEADLTVNQIFVSGSATVTVKLIA